MFNYIDHSFKSHLLLDLLKLNWAILLVKTDFPAYIFKNLNTVRHLLKVQDDIIVFILAFAARFEQIWHIVLMVPVTLVK